MNGNRNCQSKSCQDHHELMFWQINIVLSYWIAQSHIVLEVSQVMYNNKRRGKI